MNKSFYSIRFTPGELLWLMSAFGHTLPGFVLDGSPDQSPGEVRALMLAGARSLQQRDLIRPTAGGPAWQVEGLLAALADLLSNPGQALTMQHSLKTGTTHRRLLFAQSGLAALVDVLSDGAFDLALYPAITALMADLSSRLKLPGAPGSDLPLPPVFPQPAAFIRMTWQQPGIARRALAEFPQALEWAAALDELLEITGSQQALVLARAGASWWSAGQGSESTAIWKPFVQADLNTILHGADEPAGSSCV